MFIECIKPNQQQNASAEAGKVHKTSLPNTVLNLKKSEAS